MAWSRYDVRRTWRHPNRRVELVVGDTSDFEGIAHTVHGTARDQASASTLLVLAAGDLGLDPIRWLWLDNERERCYWYE